MLFTLSEEMLLDCLLLAASRHLSLVLADVKYQNAAAVYKLACLKRVNTSVGDGQIGDVALSVVLALAFDEVRKTEKKNRIC
jgi:hypothetical protein